MYQPLLERQKSKMTITSWAGLIVALTAILGSFVGCVGWLVKHYLSELKPDQNGGHNLEGRIARLENRIDAIYSLLLTRDTPNRDY